MLNVELKGSSGVAGVDFMANTIYIMQDVSIELTMPDGTTQPFTLERPNGQNPHWFSIRKDVPSGQAIYKDPLRRRQRAETFYYPEFHFSYAHHRMFTTLLLVADNIALKTAPQTTNVLLQNEDAVKNYLNGMVVAGENAANPNPVPSGSAELVFIGKEPLDWQGALAYFFYYLPANGAPTIGAGTKFILFEEESELDFELIEL